MEKLIIAFFSSRVIGFIIIFFFSQLFNNYNLNDWQCWVRIIGMAIGGTILIEYGKKQKK